MRPRWMGCPPRSARRLRSADLNMLYLSVHSMHPEKTLVERLKDDDTDGDLAASFLETAHHLNEQGELDRDTLDPHILSELVAYRRLYTT